MLNVVRLSLLSLIVIVRSAECSRVHDANGRNEEEKREVLFRIGGIWRDELSNNEAAAKVFRSLMESFPTDSRVHRELSAIYAIEEDHDGLLHPRRGVPKLLHPSW